MRKKQIMQRLLAIKSELEQEGADVAALETEARTLKMELDGIEAREALFRGIEPGMIEPPGTPVVFDKRTVYQSPEYRSAWAKVMLGHTDLSDTEQRAYTTADSSAGAVIPTALAERIYEKMVVISPVLGMITKSNIPGNLRVPREKASALAAWHSELAEITPSDDALDYISLAGYELVKLVRTSIAAMAMSISAFEDYIVAMLSKKLALPCENAVFHGTGVGQPKGIIKTVTWNAANSLTYPKSGIPNYDILMKLNSLLGSGYHATACYVMNAKTFYTHVKTIKDNDGKPLFDTSSGKLDGKSIILSEQIDEKEILLGDFSYYHMNESQPMRIDRSMDSGFTKAAIDYRGIMVLDGAPVMDEAFVRLHEAA